MRGHKARQRGPPPAATTAGGQVPSHNGHRVPRTREARTTHDETRHGTRFQGQPGPHASTPHPRPVGSGPRPHARKDGWLGGGRAPIPGRPTPRQGTFQRTAPRAPTPAHRTPGQWVVGPGRTPERTGGWGVGERPSPDAPHPGKRRPPRALSCRLHSAQSQLARARAVGFLTGPHARTPRAHSQWVVRPGRTPERTSGHGWESARPRTPRRHASARAVGLVTGPHPPIPRTHSQWVVGPGRTPELTRGRGWESACPRTPHTQARVAPPGRPHTAPTARKASSQERALWGW